MRIFIVLDRSSRSVGPLLCAFRFSSPRIAVRHLSENRRGSLFGEETSQVCWYRFRQQPCGGCTSQPKMMKGCWSRSCRGRLRSWGMIGEAAQARTAIGQGRVPCPLPAPSTDSCTHATAKISPTVSRCFETRGCTWRIASWMASCDAEARRGRPEPLSASVKVGDEGINLSGKIRGELQASHGTHRGR